MTLNITVASPRLVLCASDRRLTDGITGKVVIERSTKLTVLRCTDALALIAYNGIGRYNGKTPADWLQELDDDVRLTVLPFKEVLQTIKEETAKWVVRMPAQFKRHSFVLGAWGKGRTWVCVISNYEEACSETTHKAAQSQFEISAVAESPGTETRVLVTGTTQDVDPQDCKKIVRVAKRRGAAGVDIKNLCVQAIQNAARRRKGRGPIGSSVLWAIAERGQGVEWGMHVQGGTRVYEVPNLIVPGMKMKDIRVEMPRGAPISWGKPFPLPEVPCRACGNPIPLGYEACGVCSTLVNK